MGRLSFEMPVLWPQGSSPKRPRIDSSDPENEATPRSSSSAAEEDAAEEGAAEGDAAAKPQVGLRAVTGLCWH